MLSYVKFSRMFLENVKCLCYGTLRYITWGWKTRITVSCVAVHARGHVTRHSTCTGVRRRMVPYAVWAGLETVFN